MIVDRERKVIYLHNEMRNIFKEYLYREVWKKQKLRNGGNFFKKKYK